MIRTGPVYSENPPLTPEEQQYLRERGRTNIARWLVGDRQLKADYEAGRITEKEMADKSESLRIQVMTEDLLIGELWRKPSAWWMNTPIPTVPR